MQKLFSLIIISILGTTAYCQQSTHEGSVLLNTQPNWERLLKNRPKVKLQDNTTNILSNNQALPDTARYSHRASNGTVYHLPQDNMPCLKPYEPTIGLMLSQPNTNLSQPPLFFGNGMPNATKEKLMIFEKPVSEKK